MANFKTPTYTRGYIHRPTDVAARPVTATFKIPAGTVLAANDIGYMFKVGANSQIVSYNLTATGGAGLFDDAAGTVQIGFDGGAEILSATAFSQSGANLDVLSGTIDSDNDAKITATKNVTIKFAAVGTQTTADDSDRFVTLTRYTAPYNVDTQDQSQPAYEYTDRYNSSGVSSV